MNREEQAARNRARSPEIAAIMEQFPGAKLRYARNAAGEELGKVPELEPHLFEISAESWTELQKPAPIGKTRSSGRFWPLVPFNQYQPGEHHEQREIHG